MILRAALVWLLGFVTLVPHRENDETPERLIVPQTSLRRIELARAEAQRERLGFVARDA